ncbi:Solute carrier family 35 member F5-like 5, partial [Homarus americanus]
SAPGEEIGNEFTGFRVSSQNQIVRELLSYAQDLGNPTAKEAASRLDADNINEWMGVDDDESTVHHYTDVEIVQMVVNPKTNSSGGESTRNMNLVWVWRGNYADYGYPSYNIRTIHFLSNLECYFPSPSCSDPVFRPSRSYDSPPGLYKPLYIFNDTGFNKPFFSTYLKTSMFSLYLLGFIFWSPWRHQCAQRNHDESIYQTRDRRTPPPVPIFTLDQLASSVARDSDANAQLTHLVLWHYLPIQQARTIYNNNDEKSEPKYVPLKLQELQEKSSDGESDDSSVKSVRFSKLT